MDELIKLNLREKLLLKLFCFPPPGRTYRPEKDDPSFIDQSKLTARQILEDEFGAEFFDDIRDSDTLDLGCGRGEYVVEMARSGARSASGVEIRPIYLESERKLPELGLVDKVRFSHESLESFPKESVDIAISRDCFEHYRNPAQILHSLNNILRPGGRLYVSFGPTWYHPRGVHMFFMFRRPWPHLVFSEKTIMKVRSLYVKDGARKFQDVEGGLNRMTVSRFLRIVQNSGMKIDKLTVYPIRGIWPLVKIPVVREFFTTVVRARLTKPR